VRDLAGGLPTDHVVRAQVDPQQVAPADDADGAIGLVDHREALDLVVV
jgi:hypothetical protein